MKQAKFVVYLDARGDWRWHLAAANGRIVCQGEPHPTKQHALRAIQRVRRIATAAAVTDAPPAPLSKPISKRAKPAVKAVGRKPAVKKV